MTRVVTTVLLVAAFSTAAHAYTITQVVADRERPYVYALDQPAAGSPARLLFINTVTRRVEKAVPIGNDPGELTLRSEEGRLYVTNRSRTETRVVDLGTQSELGPVRNAGVTVTNAAGGILRAEVRGGAFGRSGSVSIEDYGTGLAPRIVVPFAGSALPRAIDVSGLSDGMYALCVSSEAASDCAPFFKEGETQLLIGAISADNEPPVADLGAGGSTECTSRDGASVRLDGSASTDPDSSTGTNDDIVSFEWFENYGTASQVSLGTGAVVDAPLPLGPHAITLKVTDTLGATGTATASYSVVDTVAPVVRVGVAPSALWPADHRMVSISADAAPTDACGNPTVVLTSIVSNEADDAPGDLDGNTTGDIQGTEVGTLDRSFLLRAESGPIFGGRRYIITYTATDASGNRALGKAVVYVRTTYRRSITQVIDYEKPSLQPRQE